MVKRLETEVWALDDCAGCGLCVAACSKQVLHWNEKEHPLLMPPVKTLGYTKEPLDSCSFCDKLCEEVCPRLERWVPLDPQVTLSARACGPIQTGTPNGVILSILSAGRSTGLLDGVVMLDLDPWELKPIARVASTVEEIVASIGPQYLWAPTLDALNEAIFDRGMENIAVVGTPCTAQAIRKMKHSTNPRLKPYQEAIRLTISTFCTGIYRPELIEEVLVKGMGVSRDMVRRLELSPDNQWLQAVLWDSNVHTIPLQQAEEFTLSGCGSCIDYLGESADLAVGTWGTSEDMSTLIIRTRTGDVFTRNAVKMNLIETSDEVDMAALDSAANEKDKRERAQEFNDVQLLMLDALADPFKRSEAIQQFVRLYRTPTRTKPHEIVRSDCTGC